MKFLSPLVLALLLGVQAADAQNYCESFDGFTVPNADKQHAFNIYGNGNNGFLQDWRVTSGTPAIEATGDIAGVNPYDGNQFALMAICDAGANWSEGLSVQYNFQQGQSYHVSLAVRNVPLSPNAPTPMDVNFVLLQNPITYNYNTSTGCSQTPALPINSDVAYTMNSFSANTWQVVSFDITNIQQSFGQLWIRSQFSAGAPLTTTFLCIDSICISPTSLSTCYSFDDSLISPSEKQHAFYYHGNGNQGFLKDWYVASGTPALLTSGDISGVAPVDGSQYALMAICDAGASWSESLELQQNFAANKTYTVSLAMRNAPSSTTPTPIDVDFVLLPSPISFNYQFSTGCTPTPAIPGTGTVVHSISNFNINAWQTYAFTFQGNGGSYLWIRPKFSSGASLVTTFLCIDSVCVNETAYNAVPAIVQESNQLENFPNPLNRQTLIQYQLQEVRPDMFIKVYDLYGRELMQYPVEQQNGAVWFDGQNLASGIYLYGLTERGQLILCKKMRIQH